MSNNYRGIGLLVVFHPVIECDRVCYLISGRVGGPCVSEIPLTRLAVSGAPHSLSLRPMLLARPFLGFGGA